MKIQETNYLAHYGILRRSGRYPWGSGGHNETQRSKQFLDYVKDLQAKGLSESEIARGFDMSINDLRASKSIASNQQKQSRIALHQRLRDKGYSPTAISRRTGSPESTVRSDLQPGAADNKDVIVSTANMLKSHISKDVYLDVGKGTEQFASVSRTRMDTAIAALKMEGYELIGVKSPQATTAFDTSLKVLAEPGTTWADVHYNRDRITQIQKFSDDGGRTFGGLHEPLQVNPKRVQVLHAGEGGDKADGMIYVRPGVEDISIGGAKYAQVRVAVGKDHYLKGMAIYKDDLPPGVDIQFNTSKSNTGNKFDAMKKNSEEPGYLPDGPHPLLKSIRRQILVNPGDPKKERVISAMNLINEEGNWEKWSINMSSQVLSKQEPALARSQLNMTYEKRQHELDNIMALTNATVRKKLLSDFADATDSAAVHLKAAALPRTGPHVILPLSKIKPTEIYAPNYNHGEKVVLVRHPHGGVFELPELIVNNNNREGKSLLGQSRDAVGIHHETAKRLSGADFDGDHVLVIPNNAGRIRHSSALKDLDKFDPRSSYPPHPGMKTMKNTQQEMGKISNLLTDMALREAPHAEVARAIKHSMVVIDAEKHNLNYKLSENDNGIKELRRKYQTGGASTLISRAGGETRVPEFKPRPRAQGGPIDLETGAKVYVPTNRTYRTGKKAGQPVMVKINKRLSIEPDARVLMSTPIGTPMERIYADHSNKLKALAGKARLVGEKTPAPKASPSAKKTYAKEVDSLNAKLRLAQRNAPLERQADIIANTLIKIRKDANPDMDPDTEKKIRVQAKEEARRRTGADKQQIKITQEEWDAIQANAISHSKLNEILLHTDMKTVRALATPPTPVLMTPTKTVRAQQMLADGYTREQIADHLGVSLSTLDVAVKG